MEDSILETLQVIFNRDLTKLKDEIELYKTEDALWIETETIRNCAGNLCLHLVGNLNTYIGATLGETGYVRQRDLEFSRKNVPKSELISMVEETMLMVARVLSSINTNDLQKEYPRLLGEKRPSTMRFLIHLTTHLTYHLGQINYHRRLLDN